jgi:hypothetical protein
MGIKIPEGARNISLLQIIGARAGTHLAPYSMGTGVSSLENSNQGAMLSTQFHKAPKL